MGVPVGEQPAVDDVAGVTVEDPHRLPLGVAVAGGLVVEVARRWVAAEPGDGHAVKHGVGRSVALLVQPVPDWFAVALTGEAGMEAVPLTRA